MNEVIVSGSLYQRPDLENETELCRFSLFVYDVGLHVGEIVECVAWGENARIVRLAGSKDFRLMVSGALRNWDRNGRCKKGILTVEAKIVMKMGKMSEDHDLQEEPTAEQLRQDLSPPANRLRQRRFFAGKHCLYKNLAVYYNVIGKYAR